MGTVYFRFERIAFLVEQLLIFSFSLFAVRVIFSDFLSVYLCFFGGAVERGLKGVEGGLRGVEGGSREEEEGQKGVEMESLRGAEGGSRGRGLIGVEIGRG